MGSDDVKIALAQGYLVQSASDATSFNGGHIGYVRVALGNLSNSI